MNAKEVILLATVQFNLILLTVSGAKTRK